MKQRALIRLLRKEGFVMARSSRRRLVFQHPSQKGRVTVPRRAGDIPRKTASRILIGARAIVGRDIAI